jgi:S-adenosylmethionine-diacylglycerol 3-amino-3-carboxypropyl transferase
MASDSMPMSPVPESAPAYGGRLMFTQSWEDPACDLAALSVRPGESLLAVTSGGDNVLGFLLTDPASVVAVDINPAQAWLFELKRAAFLNLTHREVRAFFGLDPGEPLEFYGAIRPELSSEARAFWDARREFIERGVLVSGGFERYFAMLRALLSLALGRERLEKLFTLEPAAQRTFYDREWNTRAWRALLQVACSRWVLGKKLDPSWFAQTEASDFGRHFTRLAEHAVADLPARSNYFLAQILLGRYVDAQSVPEYLRPENHETIRARLDRVTTVTADIAEALAAMPSRSIDAFALSNVFEYSPRTVFESSCAEIARVARPGARLALRNLFAPRRLGEQPGFRVDAALSKRLRDADRGFIYSAFEAATFVEAA